MYNLKFLYDEQFTDPTEKKIFDQELNRRVNERLFNGIPEKKILSLESAINKAKEELDNVEKKWLWIQPESLDFTLLMINNHNRHLRS